MHSQLAPSPPLLSVTLLVTLLFKAPDMLVHGNHPRAPVAGRLSDYLYLLLEKLIASRGKQVVTKYALHLRVLVPS